MRRVAAPTPLEVHARRVGQRARSQQRPTSKGQVAAATCLGAFERMMRCSPVREGWRLVATLVRVPTSQVACLRRELVRR